MSERPIEGSSVLHLIHVALQQRHQAPLSLFDHLLVHLLRHACLPLCPRSARRMRIDHLDPLCTRGRPLSPRPSCAARRAAPAQDALREHRVSVTGAGLGWLARLVPSCLASQSGNDDAANSQCASPRRVALNTQPISQASSRRQSRSSAGASAPRINGHNTKRAIVLALPRPQPAIQEDWGSMCKRWGVANPFRPDRQKLETPLGATTRTNHCNLGPRRALRPCGGCSEIGPNS